MILENTIQQAAKILKKHNILSYRLDAEILLSNIMGITREDLINNDHINLTEQKIKKYNYAINRRVNREPIAYIIGEKEFWSENFTVSKDTLIPRPETELLIYKIVDFFKDKKINILDVGTGSGCILLSILKELKFAKGVGIDISKKTIKTAIENSTKMNLFNRSKFKVIDIDKIYSGKYDLIVSNPPYIPLRDLKNLSRDIKNYEPLIALNGGIDGLDVIKKVIYKSNRLLKKGGLLVIEVGKRQYIRVSNILRQNGFRESGKELDYKDNVRCIISTKM